MTDTRQHLLDNILSIIETLETPPMINADSPEDGPLQDQTHIEAVWTDGGGDVMYYCTEDGDNSINETIKPDDLIFDPDAELWRNGRGEEIEAVPMCAYDYINNQLSLEYTVDSKKELLGAEILVTFGGPNIWIDTRYNNVHGAWGSDKMTRSYTDNIGLDDAAAELWGSIK